VDGCVPNFLRNYKWVMFQKWNWMGVVMSFTILVLQNFGRAIVANKSFCQIFGELAKPSQSSRSLPMWMELQGSL
jgi:hypothetical protein